MVALEEDEDAQIKGFVNITYFVGWRTADPNFMECLQHVHILNDAVPFRFVGMHFCYDLPKLRPVVLFAQRVVGVNNRVRFRAHYGGFFFA